MRGRERGLQRERSVQSAADEQGDVCLLDPIAVLRLTGLDLGEVFQEF